MTKTIAIMAPGEMGSFMGATLTAHGGRVVTGAAGRSERSLARARKAGFSIVASDDELLAEADFVLSVVPPNAAVAVAERLRPALARTARKPLYVDCNAVSPSTVARVAAAVAPSGCDFVDGCLFGGPTSGKPGVMIYVSGPRAADVTALAPLGLVVRLLAGDIGAASALKLVFAALNKGFTAVGVMALLAAVRHSCGPELIEQLSETQPGILAYVSRFVPVMFPKAYRWAPEMEEIASLLEDDAEARDVFLALSRLYRRIGQDVAPVERDHVRALRAFCQDAAARGAAPAGKS